MTNSDVISFLPRRGEQGGAGEAKVAPGERVKAVLKEMENADAVLAQLRELIAGPTRRLGEARFEELLDILAEQDESVNERFAKVYEELDEIADRSQILGKLCDALNDRMDELEELHRAEKEASRELFDQVLAALRSEIDHKMRAMSETMQLGIKAAAAGNSREVGKLSDAFNAHVAETDRFFEQAREASMSALEQRIAQWRAEIEDDRRHDMDRMAKSLVEMGERLMGLGRAT